MRNTAAILLLPALLLVGGCAATDQIVLDSTKRAPTTTIDVYKEGKMRVARYEDIAELSFLGPREDELRAQKRFIRQAQKLGGNGLIFTIENAGQKGGFTVFQTTSFVFKGRIVVYE